jgi:sialic acid synthase SpsE
MNIAGRQIGHGNPPFLIAEMAGEHRGSIDRAVKIIDAAKVAGADAIKFQLYSPDDLAQARGGRDKILTGGLWEGRTLGDLYQEAHTPMEWFPRLFHEARKRFIIPMSSVFDENGVDYLASLDCPGIKIASFELTDLALIRKAASTGKPIIISTGMADWSDVVRAASAGGPNAAMLHCVSAYPCRVEDLGLSRMAQLTVATEVFGLSDHTLGSVAPVVATALGASIIEKHITLDRKNGGPDASFSLEPHEFRKMVQDVKDAYASLGTGERPKSEIYRELRRTSA